MPIKPDGRSARLLLCRAYFGGRIVFRRVATLSRSPDLEQGYRHSELFGRSCVYQSQVSNEKTAAI